MDGNLFIITAASGTGKTSLVKALLARDQAVKLSVSHTTRVPRSGEKNGVHYHFVEDKAFLAILESNGFLESALVHGARYGTSQVAVDDALGAGDDVVLEIDWQGAEQVKRIFPKAVAVFILPPSLATLAERLNSRGQDSADVIAKRMAVAREEMQHLAAFDYVIINDKFDAALQDLMTIIHAQRLKTSLQVERHRLLIKTLI